MDMLCHSVCGCTARLLDECINRTFLNFTLDNITSYDDLATASSFGSMAVTIVIVLAIIAMASCLFAGAAKVPDSFVAKLSNIESQLLAISQHDAQHAAFLHQLAGMSTKLEHIYTIVDATLVQSPPQIMELLNKNMKTQQDTDDVSNTPSYLVPTGLPPSSGFVGTPVSAGTRQQQKLRNSSKIPAA